jgi:hypothetical protein
MRTISVLSQVIAAYRAAIDHVARQSESAYEGNVRHQIVVRQVRADLRNQGTAASEIVGAAVHIGVALAYLRAKSLGF